MNKFICLLLVLVFMAFMATICCANSDVLELPLYNFVVSHEEDADFWIDSVNIYLWTSENDRSNTSNNCYTTERYWYDMMVIPYYYYPKVIVVARQKNSESQLRMSIKGNNILTSHTKIIVAQYDFDRNRKVGINGQDYFCTQYVFTPDLSQFKDGVMDVTFEVLDGDSYKPYKISYMGGGNRHIESFTNRINVPECPDLPPFGFSSTKYNFFTSCSEYNYILNRIINFNLNKMKKSNK